MAARASPPETSNKVNTVSTTRALIIGLSFLISEMTKHPTIIPSATYAPIAAGQMGYVWMKGGILQL
jgi:hypothetical protein